MSKQNKSPIERQAFIFNKQKYNMHDGPGVRTLVFFKGCPLRCKWCSNPEGLEKKYQILFQRDLCTGCGACASVCPAGIHQIDGVTGEHRIDRLRECVGCRACEEACIPRALSVVGQKESISSLLAYVEEDRAFYEQSGGGVTLGGGEVSMQPEAAVNLLMACRQAGLNTAVETCGYAKAATLLKIAEFTDLFLFDIKHMDPEKHFALTGVRNETILENLSMLLQRRCGVKVRMPLLKGLNDGDEEIEMAAAFLLPYKDYKNFKGIDLLPYHKLGVHKYAQLDLAYGLKDDPALGEEDLSRIESRFRDRGLEAAVIRH